MALTDNPNTKHRKPRKRAVDAPTNRSWSDAQKIEAVQSYLLLGNLALTSRILNIPEVTLRFWKTTEWWKDVVDDLKLQETMQMSARLKKIVDASLGAVEDRLLNGDLMYDHKSGEMIRKPVNLRDAHKVSVDLMDKKAMLDKAVVPQQEETTDDNKLEKLAEKFAAFVNKKLDKEPEVIDVQDIEIKTQDNSEVEGQAHNLEVVGSIPTPATNNIKDDHALYDEWEEGLREGIQAVPQSSRAETQQVGENSATEAS